MRSPLEFFRRDTPGAPAAGASDASVAMSEVLRRARARARYASGPSDVGVGVGQVRAPLGGDTTLSPVVGQMLDLIGTVLAGMGQYALEDGAAPPHAARLAAERWRRHVTTGLGRPGASGGAPEVRALGLAERDWTGAAQFVVERRRVEHEHVHQTLRDLRETIGVLLQGLRTVLDAEQLSGREALAAVERVRVAITAPDSGTVRTAALAAVGELGGLLEGRARARGMQVADLGMRVSRVDTKLRDAHHGSAADSLTGLGGRPALEAAAVHAASLRVLWGHRVCLALVAVESIEAVRAVGGPVAADRVLLDTVAALARVFLRKGDALFRTDDATFAVLLGATGAAEAIPLLERIPAHVEACGARAGGAGVADGRGTPAADAVSDSGPVACVLTVGFAELGAEEAVPAWLARAERALATERVRP